MAPEMLLFSKRAWDKLSPEEQGWIRQAAKESVPYMRKQWDEREVKSLATVKAGGAEIIDDRQGPVPGRDEAGVRQVHHRRQAEGPGQARPGHEVSRRQLLTCRKSGIAASGARAHRTRAFQR